MTLLGHGAKADQNAPPALPSLRRGRSVWAGKPPFSNGRVKFLSYILLSEVVLDQSKQKGANKRG